MKIILFCVLFLALSTSFIYAQDFTIYPTYPGTNTRDFSQPGYIGEGDAIYPTLPGTNIRDWSRPGWRIDGNDVYPTYPGSSIRDWSKPGYTIEENPFGGNFEKW